MSMEDYFDKDLNNNYSDFPETLELDSNFLEKSSKTETKLSIEQGNEMKELLNQTETSLDGIMNFEQEKDIEFSYKTNSGNDFFEGIQEATLPIPQFANGYYQNQPKPKVRYNFVINDYRNDLMERQAQNQFVRVPTQMIKSKTGIVNYTQPLNYGFGNYENTNLNIRTIPQQLPYVTKIFPVIPKEIYCPPNSNCCADPKNEIKLLRGKCTDCIKKEPSKPLPQPQKKKRKRKSKKRKRKTKEPQERDPDAAYCPSGDEEDGNDDDFIFEEEIGNPRKKRKIEDDYEPERKTVKKRKKTMECLRKKISAFLDDQVESLGEEGKDSSIRCKLIARLGNDYYDRFKNPSNGLVFRERNFIESTFQPFTKRGKLFMWRGSGIFNVSVNGYFVKKYKMVTYLPLQYLKEREEGNLNVEMEIECTDRDSSSFNFLKKMETIQEERNNALFLSNQNLNSGTSTRVEWTKFDGIKEDRTDYQKSVVKNMDCLEITSSFQIRSGRFNSCKGKFYSLRMNVVHFTNTDQGRFKRIVASSQVIFRRSSNKKKNHPNSDSVFEPFKFYNLKSFEQVY